MDQLIFSIIFGISCATISVAIFDLMRNEPILNWWFRIGERIGKKIVNGHEQEYWFYTPIWGCYKCFSGQLALWVYVFTQGLYIFPLVLAISTAIVSSVLLSHIVNKITNS